RSRSRTRGAPPAHRFDPCVSRPVTVDKYQVDKYQTAAFEGNRYGVPKRAAFTRVTVEAYVGRVEVVSGDQVIASHARSRGRNEWVVDPLHYVAALSARPHALDHGRVFKGWELPGIFGELRERLEREHGRNAGI